MNIKLVDVKLFIIIILLLALIMVSACGQSTSQSSNKPTIAVSIVLKAPLLKRWLRSSRRGDYDSPGSSPETYSATPNQLKALAMLQSILQ